MNRIDFIFYKIVYYGIYLSAFIPLVIFRGFNSPTNFGKGIVFHVLTEVLFVLWVYLAIRYEKFRFKIKSLIPLAFIIFIASYSLSSFIGIDWRTSLWGSWERMGGLFSMIHYLAFFIVLVGILRTEEDWKNLFKFSIFVALTAVIYGFVQMFNVDFVIASGRSRILSTVGNPSMFSGYLLFNFYFALFLLFEKLKLVREPAKVRKNPEIIFYSIFIIASFVSIFLTQSRGTLLGLGLTLFILLSILAFKLFKSKDLRFLFRYGLIIILAVFVLANVVIYVNRDSELVKAVPTIDKFFNYSVISGSLQVSTVDSRLMVWRGAMEAFVEKPIFGWGPENFVTPFLNFYNPDLFVSPISEIYFDRPHNVFLEVASSQGLIGLAAYLFLIYVLVSSIWHQIHNVNNPSIKYELIDTKYVLLALLAAYLIYDFFFFDTITIYLMLMFFMGYISYEKSKIRNLKHEANFRLGYSNLLLVILIMAVGFLIYKTSILPVKANSGSVKALSDLGKGRYDEAISTVKIVNNSRLIDRSRAEVIFGFMPYYLDNLERFKEFSSEAVVKDDLLYFIDILERETEQNENPILQLFLSNAYKRYAMLYDKSYFDMSEDIVNELVRKYPNMPLFYLELGDIKSWQGDSESALMNFEQAYNLKSENYYLKFEFAKREILYGQSEGFDLAIQAVYDGHRNFVDVVELASRLQQAGRIGEALDLLKFVYEEDFNPNFGVYLAKLYIDVGQFNAARVISSSIIDSDTEHSLENFTYQKLIELFIILDDPNRRFEAETRAGFGTMQ